MLNADGKRELAYVVQVGPVEDIPGYDRVQKAHVGGWTILVKKDQFKEGDLGIYFEIDSKVPETKPFEFLKDKHYKIKTQKFCKGTVISQGLLMAFEDLPEYFTPSAGSWYYKDDPNAVDLGHPLTELLGVKYAIESDNRRKSGGNKYSAMVQRHQKLFKQNKLVKWLFKRTWGKKLLFIFLGKKRDNQYAFPSQFEYIHKTDEERVENLAPGIFEDKEQWIVTEKIDGTSTTFILERKRFNKFEFYVSSRNVRQLRPDQKNYHSETQESNVYWDMAIKYDIENVLHQMLEEHHDWKYVGLQGETAGYGLQGNPHQLPDVRFYGFNLIDSINGRWNSLDSKKEMEKYNINWVPILRDNYVLPDTIEEMKDQADGVTEIPDATGLREGLVYRSLDGVRSFKNVSNKYLLKRGE